MDEVDIILELVLSSSRKSLFNYDYEDLKEWLEDGK